MLKQIDTAVRVPSFYIVAHPIQDVTLTKGVSISDQQTDKSFARNSRCSHSAYWAVSGIKVIASNAEQYTQGEKTGFPFACTVLFFASNHRPSGADNITSLLKNASIDDLEPFCIPHLRSDVAC